MKLKKYANRFLLSILLLWSMQSVSQKVVIDSISKTTLLDEKATNAQGNIIKRYNGLLQQNQKQQQLIDSLRKESNNYKTEADSLRSAFNNLKFALREKDIQLESKDKDLLYNQKLFKADINALRRKRLGLGASIGYGLTGQGQSAFVGLSLNYVLIRF